MMSSVDIKEDLGQHGYVFLRNFFNKEEIINARNAVIDFADNMYNCIDISECKYNAKQGNPASRIFLNENKILSQNIHVTQIGEHTKLFDLLKNIYGTEPKCYPEKWFRFYKKNEGTQKHIDWICPENLNRYTAWIPLGNCKNGISICRGSHTMSLDMPIHERLNYKGEWDTTEFYVGDLVLFDVRCLHKGLKNTEDYYRISMESRWYI